MLEDQDGGRREHGDLLVVLNGLGQLSLSRHILTQFPAHHLAHVPLFLAGQVSRQQERASAGEAFSDHARAGPGYQQVRRQHQLRHVVHEAKHVDAGVIVLPNPPGQGFVAPADREDLQVQRRLSQHPRIAPQRFCAISASDQ